MFVRLVVFSIVIVLACVTYGRTAEPAPCWGGSCPVGKSEQFIRAKLPQAQPYQPMPKADGPTIVRPALIQTHRHPLRALAAKARDRAKEFAAGVRCRGQARRCCR